MNKKTIAVKVVLSPTLRKLLFKVLKNHRIQKILLRQVQSQLKRRLIHL